MVDEATPLEMESVLVAVVYPGAETETVYVSAGIPEKKADPWGIQDDRYRIVRESSEGETKASDVRRKTL
jgi:hypothetical protein